MIDIEGLRNECAELRARRANRVQSILAAPDITPLAVEQEQRKDELLVLAMLSTPDTLATAWQYVQRYPVEDQLRFVLHVHEHARLCVTQAYCDIFSAPAIRDALLGTAEERRHAAQAARAREKAACGAKKRAELEQAAAKLGGTVTWSEKP